MTEPSVGVRELLRHATDDLTPDIDHLVRGAARRGRSRQRRARVGTAVAGVAVIGVLGTLAAVVPQLGPSDSLAPEQDYATDPTTSATTSAAPTVTPSSAPTPPPAATLALPAADYPAAVDRRLGTSLAGPPLMQAPYGVSDGPEDKVAHFLYDGMLTTVVAQAETRPEQACRASGECTQVDEGTWVSTYGPNEADGVTMTSATAFRGGFAISVLSYNAAEGKESPPLAPQPPLSLEQLTGLATSDIWFAPLG